MEIIGWIAFGLIVGVVAKLLMPGADPGGVVITILLGIGGSLVGGYVAKLLGIGGGWPTRLVVAVVGAMLILGVYRLIKSWTASAS